MKPVQQRAHTIIRQKLLPCRDVHYNATKNNESNITMRPLNNETLHK